MCSFYVWLFLLSDEITFRSNLQPENMFSISSKSQLPFSLNQRLPHPTNSTWEPEHILTSETRPAHTSTLSSTKILKLNCKKKKKINQKKWNKLKRPTRPQRVKGHNSHSFTLFIFGGPCHHPTVCGPCVPLSTACLFTYGQEKYSFYYYLISLVNINMIWITDVVCVSMLTSRADKTTF